MLCYMYDAVGQLTSVYGDLIGLHSTCMIGRWAAYIYTLALFVRMALNVRSRQP